MLRRLLAGPGVTMLSLLFLSPPALAASDPDPLPSFQDCQPDRAHYGEIPSCTYDETGKVIDKTYDDPMGGGSGMPGEFVGLFVLALLVGGGLTAWRVSTARDIARRAGLDPDDATATALLTQNGLDATYLAASLRQNGHATPPPVQPKSTEDRLHELTRLHAQGLVTQAEYDERRSAILAEI